MNKNYIILSFAALAACAPQDVPVGDLEVLIAKRDSLKGVQLDIKNEIKELDESIAALDQSISYDAVTVMELGPASFEHSFEVLGSVQADKSLNLYPLASGKVESIHVKKGQKVSKNQLLVSLDQDILKSSLKELNTGLELAKTVYEKQRTLWLDNQIGSEIQYLQAKNNYDGLVQKVQTLKEQMEMSEVRAPFAGVVDEIFTKVGDLAAPQMPAVRIVNTTGSYVQADVPENYSGRINVGTPAEVAFNPAQSGVPTEVIQVGQFIKDANRSFSINVAIPQEMGVKPNQMVHVTLVDYANDSALVVPASLVQQDAEGYSFIYTAQNKGTHAEVVKNNIETGYSANGYTEILRGLEPGDQVIDKGSRSVRAGQKVELVQY